MKRKVFAIAILAISLQAGSQKAWAQPIPVGDVREEQYRLLQLLGDSSAANTSFSNRGLWMDPYRQAFEDRRDGREAWWSTPLVPEEQEVYPGVHMGFFDAELSNTYNSKLPYGENNEAAWYGKGINTEIKAGVYLTSNYVTITFKPHAVYQQNSDFRTPRFIPNYPDGSIRYVAQGVLPEDTLAERIDRPFRFGPDPYTTFDWGHSSVRLHYKAIEGGISTEPLWWGPGVQYALVMSNNAAGVPHAFLGTRRPLELPVHAGKLEFRWMMGLPRDSKYFDLNIESISNNVKRMQRERMLNDRLMHGLNVVYSPSFLDGFHLGLARIIHQYLPENCTPENQKRARNCRLQNVTAAQQVLINPLDIFMPFPQPDLQAYDGFRDESHYQNVNALSSIYFRWLWDESNFELYGEFYREDHSYNFRDFLTEPQHARAYTLGFQKIIISNSIDFVKINMELNSLLPGRIDDVRPQTYYYTHKTIKQGHTNRGQVLGAAIGPGSTSQYLGIDGFFKDGKLGAFVQRTVFNNHFHYEFYQRYFPEGGFKDQYRHRTNLNIGLNGLYKLNNLLLSGRVVWNKQFEYGRFNYGRIPIGWEGREKADIINIQLQFGLQYQF